jgi:hypothetical protein
MHIPASRMRSAEKRVPVSVRGGARQGYSAQAPDKQREEVEIMQGLFV